MPFCKRQFVVLWCYFLLISYFYIPTMPYTSTEQALIQLFEQWAEETVIHIQALPPSASDREYYRIRSISKQAIGAYNTDIQENDAFIAFTEHFYAKGLRVPQLYAKNLAQHIYLLQDLGNTTLLKYVQQVRQDKHFPLSLIKLYQKSIDGLIDIQINGHEGLDYSKAYPRSSFDTQAMLWDLNYFKYYFLKLAKVPFNEQALENDFATFIQYLQQANNQYFLYRDFQARNIMLYNNEPYYIDYQGGRKGALQYDLASLLYQAKANIPQPVRTQLLEYYINKLEKHIPVNAESFTTHYYAYVLMRCLQVLGAYGFRGFYERKKHFLDSIPYAIANIAWILENIKLPIALPQLWKALQHLTKSEELRQFGQVQANTDNSTLTVSVNSFSYKRGGIPTDSSGHGGGFVFDCRAIHNPGRYAPYKKLTGRDQLVINFLKKNSRIDAFLGNVYNMVDTRVEKYLSRNFDHLMASFGCTGGQHRSVYCADQLAEHLQRKYGVTVVLQHIEQERKNWINT